MSASAAEKAGVSELKSTILDVVQLRQSHLESPFFSYGVVLATGYEDLLAESFGPSQDPKNLLDIALEAGRVIVHAPAGAGKTHLFTRLLSDALERGLPILIDLKGWNSRLFDSWREARGNRNIHSALLFRELAEPRVDEGLLAAVDTREPRFVFVDGLSEVPRGVAQDILDALDELAQRHPDFAVLVADRLARRKLPSDQWRIASIAPMEVDEVVSLLKVDKADVAPYMRRPFFVQMSLGQDGRIRSQGQLIHDYLRYQVGLSADALVACSDTAFYVYAHDKTRSFSLSELTKRVGSAVVTLLMDSGVIDEAPGGLTYFRHHLFHDYLAARYLVNHPREWSHDVFSVVTFRAASFDVLSLALEQISEPAEADRFVRLVYDWNPYGPAYAIANPSSDVQVSYGMRFALSAVLAEKRWDLIEETRLRSVDALLLLRSATNVDFLAPSSFEAVLVIVEDFEPSGDVFERWRELFLGGFNAQPAHLVKELREPDSLLGWTAANVIRRIRLETDLQEQLRRLTSGGSEAVRWRAVHALGAHPSEENARSLMSKLEDDEDFWVQYGAVRSLVEMAARQSSIRPTVSKWVVNNLYRLDRRDLLGELESSLVLHTPPKGWVDFATPLVETLWLNATTVESQNRWRRLGYRIQQAAEATN